MSRRHRPLRSLGKIALGLTILLAAVALGDEYAPLPPGLTAHYFANPTWTPVAFLRRDREPSTEAVQQAWPDGVPGQFSVLWTGAVVVLRGGTYTFVVDADDEVSLAIDGEPVVESPRADGASGTIGLTRGSHLLRIRYAHRAGPYRFALRWRGMGSAPAEAMPSWLFRQDANDRPTAAVASAVIGESLAVMEWVWVGALVAFALAALGVGLRRAREAVARECDWRALRWVLAASVVLNAIGLTWGLPGTWAAIELAPSYILDALAHHFGRGWFDAYPPFHYYVLTVVMSPLLALAAMGRLALGNPVPYTTTVVLYRLVGLAAGCGTVVATAVAGTRAFGSRAGVFAGAMIALATPFVYYSKTANVDVPYLFWFALSLVFYLRIASGGRVRDYVLFAVCGMLSICTKDQAAGLYFLPPILIVHRVWQEHRAAGAPDPFRRTALDGRLLAATGAGVATFAACHNLLFNLHGFIEHVRFIAGPGSQGYRVFDQTLSGHLTLLRVTVHLIEISMGWPLFAIALSGIVLAGLRADRRRLLLWLLTPVISYYLGFINLILYNYDRFVLPICLVLAMFGGLAIDTWLQRGEDWRAEAGEGRARGRRAPIWRRALVAAAFAYTILYSGTVDVLMVRDSRYAVERWVQAHVESGERVGISGPNVYLPRLSEDVTLDLATVDALRGGHPRYYVLNVDYGRAVPADDPWGQLIAGLEDGSLGYQRIARFRTPSPWPWLPAAHPDLVGPRTETVVFSTLRNINPTIDVFRCECR